MRPSGRRPLSGSAKPRVGWGPGPSNSDQKQSLVILLRTVLTYLLQDQLTNVRQWLCSILRQQLRQAGQSKVFVSVVGDFGYAVGEHQEQIAW
jgi:hypothetical protein